MKAGGSMYIKLQEVKKIDEGEGRGGRGSSFHTRPLFKRGKSGCVNSRDVERACCEIFPQQSQQFLSAH